jgi:hypothetical protein
VNGGAWGLFFISFHRLTIAQNRFRRLHQTLKLKRMITLILTALRMQGWKQLYSYNRKSTEKWKFCDYNRKTSEK